MKIPVGIKSIAVSFPKTIRTNNYFRQNYPELVEKAEHKSLARAFSPAESLNNKDVDLWAKAMNPYLSDPFRGAVERRVLGLDESSLTLEYDAAMKALEAAKLFPEDIDLMLVTSMFPEQIVPGNAAFLAGKLGLQGAAWNLDSTCTSSLVALQTACSLVRTGEYCNVLVVASSAFSRFIDENDTLSFLVGDGAGAFVVGKLKTNQGILSSKIIHSSETCHAFFNELAVDSHGNPRMFIRAGNKANKMFSDVFVKFCRLCCEDAIAHAGVTLDEIDFFVFNTNTAWYSSVYTQALGIDPERTINPNPVYGNIGAASPIVNLYHASQLSKIRENDLVLIYTFGGTSTAGAIVMRWGDVALGLTPASSPMLINVSVGAS
ncbi:3-oxoacyl-ACP synthase III family protein [Planktothrix sp. FACHB-1355]|uniref:3-oxoacyl-ACP synthase III family protein n=1 Tax=Aerosakkonema funiforme FACHB-1375 TaxID=2949571 RepID=A0A926ZHN7_9CYAN|nr:MULTISPECIES: 3-oxoacyl-ACP synthase III family protein [Oscillatoriales]MBD2182377.1 3-oxoacyl-ACP synthase III family protein [Aerosakkonema funiforme FACHB-1375]MBD3561058.1 3-oxoacyl-ACP synthase III family protein [Planktothrix sp. FACHB-1355]